MYLPIRFDARGKANSEHTWNALSDLVLHLHQELLQMVLHPIDFVWEWRLLLKDVLVLEWHPSG